MRFRAALSIAGLRPGAKVAPGTPKPGVLSTNLLTLDAFGQASGLFEVTMQPGDNFRVAALLNTPGASEHLDLLQVQAEPSSYYVSNDNKQVPDFVGSVSPMLTVWRKLHLEFDSMAAPPSSGPEAGFVTGTINVYKKNFPVTGRSQIAVIHTGDSDQPGLFASGKLEIAGIGIYAVSSSWSRRDQMGMSRTVVEIIGVPSGTLTNLTVKLYDDDDLFLADDPLYRSLLGLQSPPLPALSHIEPFLQAAQPRFGAAYLTLVDANAQGWNTQPTIPFKRLASAYTVAGSVFDNGNLQLKGTDWPEFWAFSVVFGYESYGVVGIGVAVAPFDDGDPDREIPLSGATAKHPLTRQAQGYSVVYLECIRDYEFGTRKGVGEPDIQRVRFFDSFWAPILAQGYTERIYAVIAHEIGHAPGRQSEGTDHAELDIMETGAPNSLHKEKFSPQTINRFRKAPSWTQ